MIRIVHNLFNIPTNKDSKMIFVLKLFSVFLKKSREMLLLQKAQNGKIEDIADSV
jgi:hypothetical protein